VSGILILGMGNTLAGDDGVGVEVARALEGDARLPPGTDVIPAGSDLLRCADAMRDRRLVVVIDAVMGEDPPGTVELFEGDLRVLEERQGHAHHLSVPQALELLRAVGGVLEGTEVVVAGVTVGEVHTGPHLTEGLAERVPAIAEELAALVHKRHERGGTSFG
jgi:hydrogenase maturation protease